MEWLCMTAMYMLFIVIALISCGRGKGRTYLFGGNIVYIAG